MGKNVAIVGATGMVGRNFVSILESRDFDIDQLYLFSSSRSAGTEIEYRGKKYVVEALTETSFDREIDYALFSAGGDVSKKFAPIAAAAGVIVIDNSSCWRMDPTVPLVVPEVNGADALTHQGIIANPNCSTMQAVVALAPLHRAFGIKRIVYSTYQAVSGAGMAGQQDLLDGIAGAAPKKFVHPIHSNCIPAIDVFLDSGYTKEEQKLIDETRKILHADTIAITATAVRVPVLNCHSESINIEFDKAFDLAEVRALLENAEGVVVQDDVANDCYPMPCTADGLDPVYVGRIRRDFSVENGLNLWVVADNVRKGAALNAVQIAEYLSKHQS